FAGRKLAGPNRRVVRWRGSRPPISPSPCSAGYLGRSRRIRSATPPSFSATRWAPPSGTFIRALGFSRCVSKFTGGAAADEFGPHRRQLERVQGQGAAKMG